MHTSNVNAWKLGYHAKDFSICSKSSNISQNRAEHCRLEAMDTWFQLLLALNPPQQLSFHCYQQRYTYLLDIVNFSKEVEQKEEHGICLIPSWCAKGNWTRRRARCLLDTFVYKRKLNKKKSKVFSVCLTPLCTKGNWRRRRREHLLANLCLWKTLGREEEVGICLISSFMDEEQEVGDICFILLRKKSKERRRRRRRVFAGYLCSWRKSKKKKKKTTKIPQ